jgi:endonuclease YncB( thermonuclease family)
MNSTYRLRIYLPIFAFCLLYFVKASFAGQFKVIRVYDGDTLRAESLGIEVTVRLVGIDAPKTSKKKNQPGQPFSQRAKIHLQKLVLDKTVEIEGYGLDRYSRFLGVVFIDGKNVNLEMVKEGLAEVYRGKPPAGFDSQPYRKAEQEARKNKHGMWSQGDKYISPKDWRKQQK